MKPVSAAGNVQDRGPATVGELRILQLDGLRGIAVLLVVLFHYLLSIPFPPQGVWAHLQFFFHIGGYGVDLFFVLSGFLIGGILLESRESPRYFRTFYLRRFHRIFPLYYLWLALYAVLGLSAFRYLPASIATNWPGWKPVAIYILFLQNVVPKQLQGISASWLGPLWSLAVEEQFYLLMPLAVRFFSRRRLVQTLLAAIVVSPALRAIAQRWAAQHAAAYVATPMRADALAMGVLLALALREPRCMDVIKRNLVWLYATIAVAFGGALYLAVRPPAFEGRWEGVWSFSLMSVFFSAMVLLSLMKPDGIWARSCRLPALRQIGKVSYCVYVIHLALLTLCQAWCFSFQAPTIALSIGAVTIAFVVTWIMARISWLYIESPMVRRGHSYKY